MKSSINKPNLKLTEDEMKILDIFKNIPKDKQDEALIRLYVLAENSVTKNKI